MAPTLKGRLRRAAGALLLGLAAALPFAAGAWFARPALPVAAERAQPGFVGSATCATCHASEHAAWAASDHAHAMAAASPRSVLGDFSGVAVEDGPHRARFDLQAGRFLVETEGAAFTVTETFGRDPLQQYLVLFPDGRRQALPWAWDARPAAEGGQRWYHLMRDDAAPPGDPLHWTGRDQNWNFMCAACHSTGLQRGYDAVADRYDTAWTEIAVGCESCHGRGAAHVAWARSGAPPGVANRGLELRLADRSGGAWRFVPGDARGIARWEGPPREAARAEAESCAPCHARARPILADPPPGTRFLDSHAPALLAPGLYHADGQINGEVFEWGSFAQSKMQRAGVTCSDCHDVHRGQRRAEGDALCAQCHLPARFAARAHHGHPEESAGARCVACHMPAVTYMGVDRRRDHAFSVPRPAVSAAVGAPDACTACHTRETQGWAAAQLAAWHGPPRGGPHPALAIHAGRQGAPGADAALRAVVLEPGNPAILRATAVSLLAGRDQRATGEAVGAALLDAEPLLRAAALRALSVLPPQNRPVAARLLGDELRLVRIEAARALAPVPPAAIPAALRPAFARAWEELLASERVAAERPEAHVNIAGLLATRGDAAGAEAAFAEALRRDATFLPALVNGAALEEARGRPAAAEALLRQALAAHPAEADPRQALALFLVRQGRVAESLPVIAEAAALAPGVPRHAYVQALILQRLGRAPEAIAVLETLVARHPTDRDGLLALATFARDAGETARARRAAAALLALDPGDRQAAALLGQLGGARP